ncbi:RNA polymerase sigma factor [Kaarinaea lacus]
MPTSQPAKDTIELELLKRTAQGDMPAFQELYTRTRRQVYTYLYRMLTVRAVADIALVETYLQAAKSAAKFKGSMKVSSWLLCIARTVAHHKLNQPQIKQAIEKQVVNTQTKISLNSLDRQRRLYQAIHSLPLQHREILNLALLPEANFEDLARILKCPVANVKLAVFQAKAEFKKNLLSVGVAQ